MCDIWAWVDPTPYVSEEQARESRKLYDYIRKNSPGEFAELINRFREEGY